MYKEVLKYVFAKYFGKSFHFISLHYPFSYQGVLKKLASACSRCYCYSFGGHACMHVCVVVSAN
jgi:hypothetical protein